MTASPSAAQPQIHRIFTLLSNPTLAQTIRAFADEGYHYIAPKDAPRWDIPDTIDRLPTLDSLHALSNGGFFAVIYNPNDGVTPIACAATAPWTGGFEGYTSIDELERAWEIKIVTTRVGWMGQVHAGKCVDAIIEELGRVERKTGGTEALGKQAVECLNGAYWKKKGWLQVRASEHPAGLWGSREGYRLLVLLREFEVSF